MSQEDVLLLAAALAVDWDAHINGSTSKTVRSRITDVVNNISEKKKEDTLDEPEMVFGDFPEEEDNDDDVDDEDDEMENEEEEEEEEDCVKEDASDEEEDDEEEKVSRPPTSGRLPSSSEGHGLRSRVLTRLDLVRLLDLLPTHLDIKGKEQNHQRVCVGMVGYPNVGKSSLINTIMGVSKSSHGHKYLYIK